MDVGEDQVREAIHQTTAFIAVSKAVSMNLSRNHRVRPEQIRVIPGYAPGLPHPSADRLQKELLRGLDLKASDFLVAGVGTLDWRKGADLFLLVAREVVHRYGLSNVRFIWIGGSDPRRHLELLHDLERLGLRSFVSLVPEVEDAHSLMPLFDVLALTSREDPFPVAVLEAASAGVPVVCFEQAGGAPEFASQGAGLTVPYLDVAAMAKTVYDLQGDSGWLRHLSSRARTVATNYSVASVAPRLYSVIEEIADLH